MRDFIKQWEAANPGFKIAPEVVGWDQCQDKVTTLAAAGTPVGIAYVGSRTLKQFAQNDLIVPIPFTEEEKKSYFPFVVDTVTIGRHSSGASRSPSRPSRSTGTRTCSPPPASIPEKAADDLGRRNRRRQGDQGKDRHRRLRRRRQDLRQHHAPVPALGLHQ